MRAFMQDRGPWASSRMRSVPSFWPVCCVRAAQGMCRDHADRYGELDRWLLLRSSHPSVDAASSG